MKEIKLTGYTFGWARQGENNASALMADAAQFTALWPNGMPQAVFRRPDGATYPVPCDLVDGFVRVVLTATETAVQGIAHLEIQWLDDDVIAKSVTYTGRIDDSLDAGDAPPDPPGQGWLDEIAEIGADVKLDRIAVSDMRGEVEGLTGESRDIAQGVAGDRDATHGYMVRAEDAAEGAEDSASAASAALNKLVNLDVSAETLAPGSNATVSKTETETGYTLAFGVPRGDKGDQGERGETGATGERGLKGDKGDPGEVTQVQLDAVASQLADVANQLILSAGTDADLPTRLVRHESGIADLIESPATIEFARIGTDAAIATTIRQGDGMGLTAIFHPVPDATYRMNFNTQSSFNRWKIYGFHDYFTGDDFVAEERTIDVTILEEDNTRKEVIYENSDGLQTICMYLHNGAHPYGPMTLEEILAEAQFEIEATIPPTYDVGNVVGVFTEKIAEIEERIASVIRSPAAIEFARIATDAAIATTIRQGDGTGLMAIYHPAPNTTYRMNFIHQTALNRWKIYGFHDYFTGDDFVAAPRTIDVTILEEDNTRKEVIYENSDGLQTICMYLENGSNASTRTTEQVLVEFPFELIATTVPTYEPVEDYYAQKRFMLAGNASIYDSTLPTDYATSTTELDDVYNIYNAIVNDFPNWVSVETIGASVQARDIYQYTIKSPKPKYFEQDKVTPIEWEEPYKPTILLTTGVHGDEKSTVYGLASFLKSMLESSDNEEYAFIRNNCVLEIIPIANPDGFAANTRENANGVNINRDMIALTQPESLIIKGFIDGNFDDALLMIDFHQTTNNPGFWGYKTGTTSSLAKRILSTLSGYLERNWITAENSLANYMPLLRYQVFEDAGTVWSYADGLGLPSFTVEGGTNINAIKGGGSTVPDAWGQKSAIDLLVNTIIIALKYMSQ